MNDISFVSSSLIFLLNSLPIINNAGIQTVALACVIWQWMNQIYCSKKKDSAIPMVHESTNKRKQVIFHFHFMSTGLLVLFVQDLMRTKLMEKVATTLYFIHSFKKWCWTHKFMFRKTFQTEWIDCVESGRSAV